MRDDFAAIVRQVERQVAMINRIMRQAATITTISGFWRELQHNAAVAGFPLPRGQAKGAPVAHIRCAVCGSPVGTVEQRRGQVRVVVGRRRWLHLYPVTCPEHGPLDVSWERIEYVLRGTAHRPARVLAAPRKHTVD